MLQLYFADSASFIGKIKLIDLLKKLPTTMHEKALRFRFDRDAYNYVLGRLLLKKGLKQFGLEQELEKIVFNKNGKPLLNHIFFNISHTAHFVICGLSPTGEIGLDIEKVKPIDLKDFDSWFTPKEWADIYAAKDSTRRFYWYWTRKESIIKALGVNLSYLHQIEIDARSSSFSIFSQSPTPSQISTGDSTWTEKKWFLNDLNLGKEYFAAVCSEKKIRELRMERFNFSE